MAEKMAAACQFALVDTLSHVLPDIFQISYMIYFHHTFAPYSTPLGQILMHLSQVLMP